mmetsp:Transcript_874/g.3417  ORF Transcript_874/g.3417 Transcript_874/m.3417 type:complete len:357 (-) Transcript_874:821-1891(-)
MNAPRSAPSIAPRDSASRIASVADSAIPPVGPSPASSPRRPSPGFETEKEFPSKKSRSAGDESAIAALLLASGADASSVSVSVQTRATDATASSAAMAADSATFASAAYSARSQRRTNLDHDLTAVAACHQCARGGSRSALATVTNARRCASATSRSSALTSIARRPGLRRRSSPAASLSQSSSSKSSSSSERRGGGRKRRRCARGPAGPHRFPTSPSVPLAAPSSRGMVRSRLGAVLSSLCSVGSEEAAIRPPSLFARRPPPPGASVDRAARSRSSLATRTTTAAAARIVPDVVGAGSVRYAVASSSAGTGGDASAGDSPPGGATSTSGSNRANAPYAASLVPSSFESPGLRAAD